jgi:TolA-binding protein
MFRIFCFIIFLLFNVSFICKAEEKSDFALISGLVDSGLYEKAVTEINTFQNKYPQSKHIKQINILLARSYVNLGGFQDAIEVLAPLLSEAKYDGFSEQVLYWIAKAYHKSENFKKAVLYYDRLKDEFPNSQFALHSKVASAWCLVELKNYNQALLRLKDILQSNPPEEVAGEVVFKIARCFYLAGEKQDAAEWFKKYINDFPLGANFLRSYYWLAQIAYSDRRYDAAIKYYKVSSMDKNDIYASASLYGLGWAHWKLNNLGKSIYYFEKAYLKYPDVPFVDVVLYQLGRMYFLIKNQEQGIKKLNELFVKFPSSELADDAIFAIADNFLKLEKHSDAISYYKLGIEKYPNSPKLYRAKYNLAWALYLIGMEDEAKSRFSYIIKNCEDPELRAASLFRIGDIRLARKEYESAIEAYSTVLRQYPKSISSKHAQYRIGIAYFRTGNFRSAMKTFTQFLKNYPNSPIKKDVLFQMAIALYNDKRYDKALELFESLINNNYISEEIRWRSKYQIAWIYLQMGEEEQAIKRFDRFVLKYPESEVTPGVLYWLAQHFIEKNNLKSATKYLEMIVDTELKDNAYYLLGTIKHSQGKTKDAIYFLEKSISESPNSSIASNSLVLLSKIFSKEGRQEQAIKRMTEHLNMYPDPEMGLILLHRLADMHKEMANYSQAIYYYRKVQQRGERSLLPQIRFSIAECYEAMGKDNDAITEYLKIPYLYPEFIDWKVRALLRSARIFEEKEKIDEALKAYQNVVDANVPHSRFAKERIEQIKKTKYAK